MNASRFDDSSRVLSRAILDEPLLEFERREIDSRTGSVVTFEWWFAGEPRDSLSVESLREGEVVAT